jgi:DNA-binding transcriptional LysR family regulator
MLELRRLRLLHELHERGKIAAVADALGYTPSAVSQQLAMLEREAGVELLVRAGRGVRLTDAGHVLVAHAGALLERTALAEAELAAAAGEVSGRARIATFQSVALHIALPAMDDLRRDHPRLRCELVEAEPEEALPQLELGDVDVVIGDEWRHHPWSLSSAVAREELLSDPVLLVLPARHPCARAGGPVDLTELAGEGFASGPPGMGWEEVTRRICREHGGFEPDIRHRANDATFALALAARGMAVALLPALSLPARHPGVALRLLKGAHEDRAIFAATRAADSARPSTGAVLDAIRRRAAELPEPPSDGPRRRG